MPLILKLKIIIFYTVRASHDSRCPAISNAAFRYKSFHGKHLRIVTIFRVIKLMRRLGYFSTATGAPANIYFQFCFFITGFEQTAEALRLSAISWRCNWELSGA